MSEPFPFSDHDLEPDTPESIDRDQQDQFMTKVRAKIAGGRVLRVVDPSAQVGKWHGSESGPLYARVVEDSQSEYQPTEDSRVICRETHAGVSLIITTKGGPVEGHSGLRYATREEYVVEEEPSNEKDQLPVRYPEYAFAPLIVTEGFETAPVPAGVSLMVQIPTAAIKSGIYANPNPSIAGMAVTAMDFDPTFTPDRLEDAYAIIDTLHDNSLVRASL